MQETKTKTLVYKRCTFHTKSKLSLEQLLKAALAKRKTVGSRRESLTPDGESPIWLVVGQHRQDSAFLFGLLVRYAPGTHPSFVVDDATATSLSVEHFKAPKTKDGKDREPVDSMLFFAVTGNHVAMMQSLSLRALHLERHLQWLLHRAGELAGDSTLRLEDQVSKQVRDALAEAPVRSLIIGGDLAPSRPLEVSGERGIAPAAGREVRARMQVDVAPGAPGLLETIKSLVSRSDSAKLNLDDLDGSNIEYSIEIRYKRQTTDDGQRFLNRLGSALRHADGVETKVELVGGGVFSGDDLRLTGSVRVTTRDGVPSPEEVFEALRSWLLERVKSGEIAK